MEYLVALNTTKKNWAVSLCLVLNVLPFKCFYYSMALITTSSRLNYTLEYISLLKDSGLKSMLQMWCPPIWSPSLLTCQFLARGPFKNLSCPIPGLIAHCLPPHSQQEPRCFLIPTWLSLFSAPVIGLPFSLTPCPPGWPLRLSKASFYPRSLLLHFLLCEVLSLQYPKDFFPYFIYMLLAKSLQLRQTPCDPVDCGPPGSSVRGILQAWILEWVARPCSYFL